MFHWCFSGKYAGRDGNFLGFILAQDIAMGFSFIYLLIYLFIYFLYTRTARIFTALTRAKLKFLPICLL